MVVAIGDKATEEGDAIVGTTLQKPARLAILITIAVVLGHVSTSVAVSESSSRVLRFNVVERTPRYVEVNGHHSRFRVDKSQHGVTLHRRYYVVVRRTRTYVALRAETPTPTPPPAGSTFNVMNYGAHGDGVTDDATSIKAAMDACAAAGGGTVYIPAGTYYLVEGWDLPDTAHAVMKVSIPIRSNCTVAGDGVGKTILVGASSESGRSVMGSTGSNIGVRDLSSVVPASQYSWQYKGGLKLCGVNGGASPTSTSRTPASLPTPSAART